MTKLKGMLTAAQAANPPTKEISKNGFSFRHPDAPAPFDDVSCDARYSAREFGCLGRIQTPCGGTSSSWLLNLNLLVLYVCLRLLCSPDTLAAGALFFFSFWPLLFAASFLSLSLSLLSRTFRCYCSSPPLYTSPLFSPG